MAEDRRTGAVGREVRRVKPRELVAVVTALASLAAAVSQTLEARSQTDTTIHTDASLRACLVTLERVVTKEKGNEH
jgi:hypothetical protein